MSQSARKYVAAILGGSKSLLSFATPYWRSLALVGTLMLFNSATTLAVPWLLGHMAGGIVTRENSAVGLLVALLLASLLVMAVLNTMVDYIGWSTASRITADLREEIYRHLQGLPLGFHRAHRQGDLLALMTREVTTFSEFLTETLVSIIPMLVTAAGAIFLMFRIDWKLALAVPLLLPVFFIVLRAMRVPLREVGRLLQEAEADVVATARQNLEMLPMIKAFAREDQEAAHFRQLADKAKELAQREHWLFALGGHSVGFIAGSAAVVLLAVMGRGVAAESMTPSEMLTFLFYAALLTRPATSMAQLYGKVQRAYGALSRMQAVLLERHEPGYDADAHFRVSDGEIRFSGVRFKYADRTEVLKGVDLLVRGGETIAISGYNGAGKSTIISLLLRYSDPDEGAIFIDGKDIAGFDVKDLRRQIGLVSQQVFLFNGTIGENIGYGLEGATSAQIEQAARAARADAFIAELPLGMDTPIGDLGVCLSGGQRQRVALARAMLKDPPIFILDEANSMYDLEGETDFVEACAQSLKDRTVVLISHRKATLALADRIVRLEDGVIHEEA